MAPEEDDRAPVTGLVAAPPPTRPSDIQDPAELESYLRAAMHQDRSPGNLLVVCHPLRMYKVPRHLLDALRSAGFNVVVVETQPDRVTSVRGIRDGLVALHEPDVPLDLMVISGDGSLDHHVLVAAFWAFYPELVSERAGVFDSSGVREADLAGVPLDIRAAFLTPTPDGSALEPNEATVRQIWVLRGKISGLLRKGKSAVKVARRADRLASDPVLRFAVLAALLPHKVTVRAHGFDLSGLATATQEQTFQGLYPYIRSIAPYPAGTAADNALYAGVPGWGYAQVARLVVRFAALDGLRSWMERRAVRRFVEYYLRGGVVVPARFSVVAFDGDWQVISSHAAGGPAAGLFFSADLEAKAKGLLGYLLKVPSVVLREGVFGSTIVRISARRADGLLKSHTEAQMAEGLYTNRTFIAGVGSVPSTNPTSFAGQSSLIVVPPIWSRDDEGRGQLNFRGVGTLAEAIAKGVLARIMHLVGLNVGTLAGGGRFRIAAPEHQVTLKEGEEMDVTYLSRDRRPRSVATQVSGDPFQAWRMTVRVAWGPIPLLAEHDSLLMASARRSLRHLRVEQTYRLRSVFIGGLHYFRHLVGSDGSEALIERTGLFAPPRHLPRRIARVQQVLLRRWEELGTGAFVDTSERGLQLGRRGRYAHNNDQSAHLVILRERHGVLVVRLVRATPGTDDIYESITYYRAFGPSYVIHDTQTRVWSAGQDPRILREEHYFRSADDFRQEAPTFFPFITGSELPSLPEATEEVMLD